MWRWVVRLIIFRNDFDDLGGARTQPITMNVIDTKCSQKPKKKTASSNTVTGMKSGPQIIGTW
jgi:hypothetical protein